MAEVKPRFPPDQPQLDAAAVRAFAHPLRVRLYYLLEADGPATASGLAVRVGESSGSTSYHLRQLARHGLIVEVEGRGTAKERWWEPNPKGFSMRGDRLRADPATAAATDLLLGEFERKRAADRHRWLEESVTAPDEWVEASVDRRRTMVLTAVETARLASELDEVTERYRLLSTSRDLVGTPDAEGRTHHRVVLHLELFPLGAGTSPETEPQTETETL